MQIGRAIPQELNENAKSYHALLAQLQERRLQCLERNERRLQKHTERGKLFVRDRVTALLDPGSPFLEIAALAGLEMYEGVAPGAGIVVGIGRIAKTWCMLVANDATVKGGTYFPLTVKKHLRAQQIALENALPCVYLVDSGGAYLPMQDEVFPDREHFGRIFFNQAQMSKAGIPQIALVMGSCTAGGAYVPAMSDEVCIVQGNGTIFLGGPPLVKAATGDVISAEELGGAEVHSRISGVADYMASDEYEAFQFARDSIATLSVKECNTTSDVAHSVQQPLFPIDDIYSLIPCEAKKNFPMRDILARLLDGSVLNEFKPHYGNTIICGFAHIEGHQVGIIANDGILFSESALKATHFIQICDQRNIPLVFFQNIVGFMVGKEYEHKGIAKHGAKMVRAVACASVAKYTVVVGGSFGAGNYAMAGRAYDPRFLFVWPNARTAVMGPEQAAKVLTQVREDAAKSQKKKIAKKELLSYRQKIEAQYEEQASAYYATARLWDDGIIDPKDTRHVLHIALSTNKKDDTQLPAYGIFRM